MPPIKPTVLVLAVAAALAMVPAVAGAAPEQSAPPPADFVDLAEQLAVTQKSPDDVAVGAATASSRSASPQPHPLVVTERERSDRAGRNDELTVAQRLSSFGTGGRRTDAHILGTLAEIAGPAAPLGPLAEDDGAIPLANPTGLSAHRPAVRIAGAVGDGPHGSAGSGRGDFDFFAVEGATAGQLLTIDVDAVATGSQLDAVVAVTDGNGAILAFNDDSPEIDSFLEFTVPAEGDYFVALAAFGSLPANPFDSASGTGATSEGAYEVTLSFEFIEDVDTYQLDLRRGDVLGASVTGGARVLELFAAFGELQIGAGRDLTAEYPDASPLRVGGNATLDHVATYDGPHYVRVSRGLGEYDVDVRVRRPALEGGERGVRQILFLDFDGAFVDPSTFGTNSGTLSPLATFLPGWGLDPDDEDAVIDAIVARFTENVVEDPGARGGNERFAVEIRNSRDHADPWGQPNVSRVVIGGTKKELDFDTIGLAPSVDPGNFDREETAVVLLDQASAPAGTVPITINDFVTPDTDVVALVGSGLGFVASHEAGHILGNHHTTPNNGVTSMMDTFDITQLGLGPDFVFGTADDVDVDFVTDEHTEGYTGQQDTLGRVAFALSSPRRSP